MPCRRLLLAAAFTAFVAAPAFAGGMPPEIEIDANGEPLNSPPPRASAAVPPLPHQPCPPSPGR